ncbi:MAG TPA: D-aminoacyl-tRNA deacylase [Syntrophales bacterium]|nr:D-aminoacyl-tRNA deacylase [Syntrophales bacterium]
MKAVIQRVDSASVSIDGVEISRIGAGLLVLLGVERGDGEKDADFLLDKIIHLRIFEDGEGKMNLSLLDISGELLVVSQFTLLADCRKGRRPSFTDAAEPETATKLYEYLLSKAKLKVAKVGQGQFQAMMKVGLVNDGPVTILLDSRRHDSK